MHHMLRYGQHDVIKIYVYGDFFEKEKKSFELMAKRNVLNYGYKGSKVIFANNPEQVVSILE